MTSQFFFWNVFPWVVTVLGLLWLGYDRYIRPRHDEDK